MQKSIALLWDFDGTLVDSRLKNYNVARSIIEAVTGKRATNFEIFSSLDRYTKAATRAANWRVLYRNAFAMKEEQVDEAGRLWTSFQMKDETESPVHAGIGEALHELRDLPHGIVSQNSRENIVKLLGRLSLSHYFKEIVGYEEVDIRRQKPEPDGLLYCLERLTQFKAGTVFYIGDHDSDFHCAQRAHEELERRNLPITIFSIGAHYGTTDGGSAWSVQPHFVARKPIDIKSIVTGFEEIIL